MNKFTHYRDYFAGQALQGIITNEELYISYHLASIPECENKSKIIPSKAYVWADAMMEVGEYE